MVDDDVDLAEQLAEILSAAGHGTATAASAELALERVEEGGIAALVTDFRLPELTGAQLISELRRRGHAIPAVVISAYTDDATIELSELAGAFDVLPKPVDIPRLVALVASLDVRC